MKVLHSVDLTDSEEKCIRLSLDEGGCGIAGLHHKRVFGYLAGACQYMPRVAQLLFDMGWSKDAISGAINTSGVDECLRMLVEKQIYIGSDGVVVRGAKPTCCIASSLILWGLARKMFSSISLELQREVAANLRNTYESCFDPVEKKRQLAKLNSCAGPVSGKWLKLFPSSWWPKMTDDIFVLALRFRVGMKIGTSTGKCMHTKCKEQLGEKAFCVKDLDAFGDHCVLCGAGGHMFTRHTALNTILVGAGRQAGYQALVEQVVPELGRWQLKPNGGRVFEEARVDVELFGHPIAPDRLLDGTIRHPASSSNVGPSSRVLGFAATEGEKCKAKRYLARNGKEVAACSMETWGRSGEQIEALLRDLAVLATRRQQDRGVVPTKWYSKWILQISLSIAIHVGKALFEALPTADRYYHCRTLRIGEDVGIECEDPRGDFVERSVRRRGVVPPDIALSLSRGLVVGEEP